VRREDLRFLTGEGRFSGDLVPPGAAHAVFLRSPHAHARVLSIGTEGLAEIPGFLGLFAAADLAADGPARLPLDVAFKRPDGRDALAAQRPILADGVARHLGEAVAVVVGETLAAALDAAERAQVDYEELPFAVTLEDARAAAATVYDDAPDNVGFGWQGGDAAAVEAAFAEAANRVGERIRISRVAVSPLEPRGAVAWTDERGRLTLLIGHQQPQTLRNNLAQRVLHLPPERLRVIAPDVGGSFGLKTGMHLEELAVLWLARRLGRPVAWLESRSESLLADDQSRDVLADAELALDREGQFTALRIAMDVNCGAYLSGRSLASVNNIGGVAGVYRIPAIAVAIRGIVSHSVPTGPYRGAGRPEATNVIERLVDAAARRLGVAAFELRRRNLIPAAAMPYKTALTFTYDCGDFAGNMARAAELADLAGFPARRAEAKARGRLRGLGVVNLIEVAGGPYGRPFVDKARVTVLPDGSAILDSGALSTGQGLETALPALIAERLGIAAERIAYRQGDTDFLDVGRGSGGSAGAGVSGVAAMMATDKVIERGRALAAEAFEAAEADVTFAEGAFRVVGTDRVLSLAEVAALAEKAAPGTGLAAELTHQPAMVTFPNGCHLCEVEIDPQTGAVEVLRYTAVEDIGRVLNEALVDGQLHGGIAQGISQALAEAVVHDAGSGQLLTGSFMDYGLIRAVAMPPLTLECRPVPTAVNPLGAKGVGEAGTVGALVATMNAVNDALATAGVDSLDMPATPARVWAALQDARRR
jgi:carbon-monoxide dehydrogenase large subunit